MIERKRSAQPIGPFANECEAARFASMEARALLTTVTSSSSERLQIKIFPNFGSFPRWVGEWVAQLYFENGVVAGSELHSDSMEKVKRLSVDTAVGERVPGDRQEPEWTEADDSKNRVIDE